MPNVPPTINVELEVESGEVENYEVGHAALATLISHRTFPGLGTLMLTPARSNPLWEGHASVSFLRLC